MSDFDKGMEWLEDNIDEAARGLELILGKIMAQLRYSPERFAMALLLRRGGRKHLAELKDELSLSRKAVAYHERLLEKYGIVSSKLDKAPEGYPAVLVRYVELTPMGENMMKCLEVEGGV